MMASVWQEYRFPEELGWPGTKDVKKWAAKAGRARTQEEADAAEAKLRDVLAALDDHTLILWADVVMIDPRFQGATGQGGYWAKASEAVNRMARSVRADRRAL